MSKRVRCYHCGGSGEQGCSGGYLEMCGTCDGTGKVDPCVVCGGASVRLYPGYSPKDDPSCGRPACEIQIQAAMDYHEERGV